MGTWAWLSWRSSFRCTAFAELRMFPANALLFSFTGLSVSHPPGRRGPPDSNPPPRPCMGAWVRGGSPSCPSAMQQETDHQVKDQLEPPIHLSAHSHRRPGPILRRKATSFFLAERPARGAWWGRCAWSVFSIWTPWEGTMDGHVKIIPPLPLLTLLLNPAFLSFFCKKSMTPLPLGE